ncbi:MAG: molybdopterin-guanine dinucleotide biosynthesis protein B [Candidatus Helarchaeota archaeon]
MIPTIICVTSAHRKQGKTQLVMRIVKGLIAEGFKVGTIKHIGANSKFDSPLVKDTTRHAEAGASIVVAVTKSETITIDTKSSPSLQTALQKFSKDFDFIIVEGFKQSKFPRFIVIDKAEEIAGLNKTGHILALTGRIAQKEGEWKKLEDKYEIVAETDVKKLLNIIRQQRYSEILKFLPNKNCGECGFHSCEEMAEKLLIKEVSFNKCPHMTAQLSLEIDGQNIFVKDFVQNILRGSIEGMLQTLKGVPRIPKKIVIQIERE